MASWYGPGFHGKLTASGERYDMNDMTCAHRSLPFGTRLKLTNKENGRSAVVVVNDRGPFVRGRQLDLSRAAAERLGIIKAGTGRLNVVVLDRDMKYARYIKESAPAVQGPYTLQVGAFAEESNAMHVKKGLELNHGLVYMTEKWVDGRRFYRVRVGKFSSHEDARHYAARLADEGYECNIISSEL